MGIGKARPIGITLLSVWYVFSGISSLLLQIPIFATLLQSSPDAAAVLSAVGIQPFSDPLVASLVSAVILAAGIGVWMGYRWGWYVGSFYCFYFMVGGIEGILESIVSWNIYYKDTIPNGVIGDVIFQLIKIGSAFVIPLIIYIYYYRRAVKEYFNVADVNNLSVIFKHIGILLAFSIVYGLLA